MIHSWKFRYVAVGSVMLPGLVLAASMFRSGETFQELLKWLPINWGLLTLPQLFVIVLAIAFPKATKAFATRALLLLSALFLVFSYVTSLDPNGPMLWIFYFSLSILLLVVLSLLPSSRENPRGL